MKFPASKGVGIVRVSQRDDKRCYNDCIKKHDGLSKRAKIEDSVIVETPAEQRVVYIISEGDVLYPRMLEKEVSTEPLEDLVKIVLDDDEQGKKDISTWCTR